MKLFLDTANLKDIDEALKGGFIRGVTTNPSLLAKEPKGNYIEHMKKIVALCKKYGKDISLSVEVFSNDPKEMVKQAKEFVKALRYKHLAVKIPIGYKNENYLSVVKELSDAGIVVNCTACHSPMQLMMAAASGAKYVSLFYNRLRDGAKEEAYAAERDRMFNEKVVEQNDYDPNHVLRETRELLKEYPETEIIAGSIRTVLDVKEAGLNGAHIVTVSLKALKAALAHFKTDHAVDQFLKDFSAWLK
ncbi:MAG: hypothetical protein A2836_01900 [Candidatus Taylorbacteria bacterium RIFCSPHIGHO2_01_FULL_45_63]|uniref:Transaldolase n=1 Tax=Candidatus Taylorbacteria bacterium RIFCSPHIGHO2_02_FULL_45_35 TaxID=1802311 RepID=A0A1G2MV77_9BACT|nr:MAG: hypothetical protein A2836_01900 [Candidatus Taylorbacteria bacterium RIFCSPHIGHO2_01_FULL_45_63]OHA27664.1 MAG: hypothetical protein A3D56_00515 [Candidatus Taylorbacteria bacterium RIFCSPHIGHO2_02_FULL_45_35]OHA34785.1 MAG: hypothetical protein A3A22_02015 [Candidatus Taylorbacteria bacterium RIFCSPLOWO2_01_FULL_45_34b]